jgi:TetR/AcrR family transcriptional repressor of bet genes
VSLDTPGRNDSDAQDEPKPRTAPREVRRAQLIEATIDCIAERGISGTTMARVTQRAGLSVGIVSLHFESKDNLLMSTLLHLSEEVRATWAGIAEMPDLDTVEKVRRIAVASFDPAIFTPTRVAVWFAFFGEAHYRQIYREMVEGYDDERGDVLIALCRTLVAETEGDTRDPEALTDAIECLSDGLWLNAIVYPDHFTRDYCLAQMHAFLAAQFPAHFGQPSGASTGGTSP